MRTPYTREQHTTLGLTLATFRDRILSRAIVTLSASYGPRSREVRAALKALNAVDRLRCVLDDAACNEDLGPSVYYPHAGQRALVARELNIDGGE